MAKTSMEIIHVLRRTAARLEATTDYQWGHMGACNCGFLTQEITRMTKVEIHHRAMESHGDWTEQLNDYCPTSGLPLDLVITEMVNIGFDVDDLRHLERLSDPKILRSLPNESRYLTYNNKQHVILYLKTWANQMESGLLDTISLAHIASETERIKVV